MSSFSQDRPETTLFMLSSLDGKISTGGSDDRDTDKDFHRISGVCEGRHQYYELEQKTDLVSFNTGRVFAKIGWNDRCNTKTELPVTFVLVDNKPHLTAVGIENILEKSQKLILITTCKSHPAKSIKNESLKVLYYEEPLDFKGVFSCLKKDFNVERMTIQSGGTMNAVLLREGVIDHISFVMAPILIGGKNTASLVDGENILTEDDLKKIKPLKLQEVNVLENSYLHLKYDVINENFVSSRLRGKNKEEKA